MRVPQVRCREIVEGDIDAIADLLTRGFSGRTRDYWMRGLGRQRERTVPPGYPRYGYLLENDRGPVGVLAWNCMPGLMSATPLNRSRGTDWIIFSSR